MSALDSTVRDPTTGTQEAQRTTPIVPAPKDPLADRASAPSTIPETASNYTGIIFPTIAFKDGAKADLTASPNSTVQLL